MVQVASKFILLALAFGPAAYLLWEIVRRSPDVVRLDEVLGSLGLGFVASIPITVGEIWLQNRINPMLAHVSIPVLAGSLRALAGAAVPEEIGKFLVMLLLLRSERVMQRPYAAVILGVAVSLGFAMLENLIYIGISDNWARTAALRAVSAMPGHAFYGAFMGCFAAMTLLEPERRTRHLALMLLAPILAHWIYDAPVMAMDEVYRAGGSVWSVWGLWIGFAGMLLLQVYAAIRGMQQVLYRSIAVERSAQADPLSPGTA
ncbi:MAG TPA: PrsW family glutamic-type intramembrane protease [Stellaceae bacterium]|nr:PrsW family glutamic-type intramembrane protease [Stellaceae bacterium]